MNPILYRYKDTESVIKVMDGYTPGDGWSPLYGPDEVKASSAAALERAERVPKPFPHEDMDKVALARYTVAKSKSTIWPCSVVAGDGEQEPFSGSESTCKHVARKLTGAFLDGAFYAHSTTALLSEAEIQDLRDRAIGMLETGFPPPSGETPRSMGGRSSEFDGEEP